MPRSAFYAKAKAKRLARASRAASMQLLRRFPAATLALGNAVSYRKLAQRLHRPQQARGVVAFFAPQRVLYPSEPHKNF